MTDPTPERRTRPRGRGRIFADALYAMLRFIARHVRGFYGAIITYLSFSFFVGLAAIWGFAELADEVLEGETQRFDERVLEGIAGQRTEFLDRLALEVTALGNTLTLTILVLLVSVFLWLTRHRYSVALLMIAVAGSGALNWLLKDIFGRPRPTIVEAATDVTSQSFPSGHSMSAMVAYGTAAYLVARLEPTAALRLTTWFIAALVILAIGVSRMYLGVHYPSDVIAGYIAGLAWTALVVSGLTAIRYFAKRKPDVVEEERDLEVEQEREEGLRA